MPAGRCTAVIGRFEGIEIVRLEMDWESGESWLS